MLKKGLKDCIDGEDEEVVEEEINSNLIIKLVNISKSLVEN